MQTWSTVSTVKSVFSAVIPPSWMVFLYKATMTYAHQHFTTIQNQFGWSHLGSPIVKNIRQPCHTLISTSSQFKINKSPTRSYVVGNAHRVTTLSSASLRWSASRSTLLSTLSSSSSTLPSALSFELNVAPADLHQYMSLCCRRKP